MLEEVIKLHRFAGISPEKSLAEAGRLREAMVAADQSMVIRCFGDDFAGFVDDDFHALPPVQRPLNAAAMLRRFHLTSCRPRAFQCSMVATSADPLVAVSAIGNPTSAIQWVINDPPLREEGGVVTDEGRILLPSIEAAQDEPARLLGDLARD